MLNKKRTILKKMLKKKTISPYFDFDARLHRWKEEYSIPPDEKKNVKIKDLHPGFWYAGRA